MKGYFTTKGLALSAKLLTGAELSISRVVAGSGQTKTTAAALSGTRQTLAVNTPTRSGNTATIPATLAAASASGSYTLTELGVYANDPDEGEILYKIYKLSRPVNIVAGSSMVLRFYLEETVSQDLGVTVTCSPAGLVTEEKFAPTRDKVFLSGKTNYKSVALDAGELQGYLDNLPKFLTEDFCLTVSGTLTDPLVLSRFCGPGTLHIEAAEAGGFVMRNSLTVSYCQARVRLFNVQFEEPEDFPANEAMLTVDWSPRTAIYNSAFTGTGAVSTARAIGVSNESQLLCSDCSVQGFAYAVICSRLGIVLVESSAAAAFEDNQAGCYVWMGGVVLLAGNTPELLGGSANVKSGGMIVAANGSLL